MDLIFKNGKIMTMDSSNTKVEALGIKAGKIAIVGTNDVVLKHKGENTKVIDLNNKLVLPGFNDSHMHMLNYGYTKQKLSLNDCKSIEELIELGKSFITDKNIKEGKWILGRGWNQDYFNVKRFPTRDDLDKVSLNHPVCYTRACGHVAVANSKALEMVKDAFSSELNNDHIEWDKGTFREDALKFLYGTITSPSVEDIKSMLIDAGVDLIKCGITSVQTDDFDAMPDRDYDKVLKAYYELIQEKKLPVRVYEQCLIPDKKDVEDFINKGYTTGKGNERFKIGPLKLLLDGSLGARTALMCDGYHDDPSTKGLPAYTQEKLNDIVAYANENNMQVAMHAIGDGAMYMGLDSFKFARDRKHRKDDRHGIVHCQITDKKLIERFADENILAYIQPIFLDYDLHIVEDRVGTEKAQDTYNWNTLLKKGVHVSGGSDAPVVSFNILENIYSAVTRKDLNGCPDEGWLPNERLTVDEAVRLFTINGAYASYEEDIKGSIEVGKLADIVVLSEDIYNIEEDKIKDAEVVMTILDGDIVYDIERN